MNKTENIYAFAEAANLLNTRFYQAISEDFSRTRQNAWPGWEQVAQDVFPHLPENPKILDIACGNMRFANFCAEKLPQFDYLGLDNNEDLANDYDKSVLQARQNVKFHHADLLKLINMNENHGNAAGAFDLVVSFGFFHHIPSYEMRLEILKKLISFSKPGAFVAINLWQFMNDDKLAAKAKDSTKQALAYFDSHAEYEALKDLQANDYFLSWDKQENIFRYCHHFDEQEIEKLVKDVENAQLISSYNADGRNNELNRYLIFHNNY